MAASVDTQGVCTAQCCENFTLVIDGREQSHTEIAACQADPVWVAEATKLNDLARLARAGAAPGRFECVAFDQATRKCTIYAERPDTCRQFPAGYQHKGRTQDTCHHCGFCAVADVIQVAKVPA